MGIAALFDRAMQGSPRPRSARPRMSRWQSAPLSAVESLEDRSLLSATVWTQRGGDAGHTAYVDLSFDPATLSESWFAALGYPQSGTGSWSERAVAIDEAHVYRTALEGYAPSGTYHVIAYDVQTGDEVWHRTFRGNAFEGVGEPSVAGGIVYVNRAGHSSGGTDADLPRIYGLDAGTGATLLERRYSAQWGSNERPVIDNNQLIVEDGYYGGISAYTASTLSRQWFVGRSAAYNPPFAALDENYAYAFGNEVYRRSDGTRLPSIVHPTFTTVVDPMVSDSGRVFFDASGYVDGATRFGVSAFDGSTHQHLWTTTTPFGVGAKAAGNGVVAVTSGRDLLILNETDGSELQRWQAPFNLGTEIVLTPSHAFVQSSSSGLARVHAVDITTGEEVWSFEHRVSSGSAVMEMAFGSGHLVLSHHLFVRAFGFPDTNQGPVAADLAETTPEDTALNSAVTATDADGDSLTYSIVSGPTYGTLTSFNAATGDYTYVPVANYHGPDAFTFRASDGRGGSDEGTVSITVTSVNDVPIARGWQFTTLEDTPLDEFLRASDADGDPLVYSLVSAPSFGTVQLDSTTGTFTYTPAPDYNGTVSFTFQVNDGTADSNIARIFVTVWPVNDAPVANNMSIWTHEDTVLRAQVVANDIDGDPVRYELVSGPSHGTITSFDPVNGQYTYVPAADYHGNDSFTYRASDGSLDSNTAAVAIRILPVNDDPEVLDAVFAIEENSPAGSLVGSLTAWDVDGDALSFSLSGSDASPFSIDPQTGVIRVADAALLDFEARPQWNFQAHVADGAGGQATAQVRVDLTDVLEVEIDVLPGDPSNQVSLDLKEIEVAILGSTTFDPLAMLDLGTLRLRAPDSATAAGVTSHPKHGFRYEQRDVNGDGVLDLVLKFATSETGVQAGDTSLLLEGNLLPEFGGGAFSVEQEITVISSSKGGGNGKNGNKR